MTIYTIIEAQTARKADGYLRIQDMFAHDKLRRARQVQSGRKAAFRSWCLGSKIEPRIVLFLGGTSYTATATRLVGSVSALASTARRGHKQGVREDGTAPARTCACFKQLHRTI